MSNNAYYELVVLAVTVVLTYLVIPLLRRYRAKLEAEIADIEQHRSYYNVSTNRLAVARLQEFLNGNAQRIARANYPHLAARLLDDETMRDRDAIKNELYEWGSLLRRNAIEYFANQGIDVVRLVGSDYLDALISRAADEAGPYPGKSTSAVLCDVKEADRLARLGVDAVRLLTLEGYHAGDGTNDRPYAPARHVESHRHVDGRGGVLEA